MALMELFYKYCENNTVENVEIENKESCYEEALVETQKKSEREELEEGEFPLRESEQQKGPSDPQPKQHDSITAWEEHMRQAEISKCCNRYKELNSMGRQRSTTYPNNHLPESRNRKVQNNRRILQRGKVTPSVRDLFRF